MSNSTTASTPVTNADGSPLLLDIQNLLTTRSLAAYGTVPGYPSSYVYTVSPLSSTNWNMMGQMGAADYNFGGKTWSTLYYVQQVNFKGTLATGNVLQSWI